MAHIQTNPSWVTQKYPGDLSAQVRYLIQFGYVVVHQNEKTAQLVRKKKFSLFLALCGLLLFFFGFLLYLVWYLAKRDDTIYLDITAQEKASL
ncbi:hypothetical protein A2348_04665 [Candidatus Uhrbacteria bacterium RIFOXYB12_FULL_58_10]|uniref:Uncharacterized protein n=1 Tax=Candidatus Uhrbacteria bacterium RIFOXYB2_FULL_57_15 TaxID=1802422 RepID=A0A1F7W986_9BACT|nr:MAG: hypothetical protein A2348_04665 [Candidatus Uhrbacteria bacterium RIFOXYB12_FULL_58_10]OGL98970.1 MAG: hypothetical protein A2501_02475 [Candidatus Uhrbacteria bacterium RIFOXYC12_FULL_57_11]OGL99156.1 MAG: hypothetical protein A2304_03325 [Candidatus Uhrbacteria bacterium RIFOXYB2_FULL_57_15]